MKDVNERLGNTIRKITPNDVKTIINELDLKKKKKWYQVFKPAYILALTLFLAVGVFGVNTINASRIYSTISLDVNPSIEINVNANDKVISVNAYNDDAKTIIGNMDFKGSSLEVTVNALIGSLLRNGYLSDTANSILVSVDGKDANKNKKIEEELVEEIEEILSSSNLQASVLSQVLDKDDIIEKYAQDYGISKGKATLIYEIINSENSAHTFEELISLTINELNLLVSSPKVELNTINTNGQSASDKGYIGKDLAKQKALAKAQVNENDIYDYEVELDYEHGVMVYEVEFKAGNLEYDVKVNALDGTIVHFYSEVDDDYQETKQESTSSTKTNYSKDDAKQIAINNANVSNVTDYEIELDDGKYEISFKANGIEYEYEIDPATGKIIKQEKEIDDDYYEAKQEAKHEHHDDDDEHDWDDDDDLDDDHDDDDDDDDDDDHDDDDDDDD